VKVGIYEGPELAGLSGRRVRALAAPIVVDTGAIALSMPRDRAGATAALETACTAISLHPASETAMLATFEGWTRDGVPMSRKAYEAIPLDELPDLWFAVWEVWATAGFFGPTLMRGLRKAGEMLAAAQAKEADKEADKEAEEIATSE
jgi:hypothetical protein